MRLKRLVLENVCQHRKLEHTWQPGLNGIVGPNGSGKTNVVKAMKFAITGQFDNAGLKADNVYQLARDKARSQVVLELEHNGVVAEITRVLRRGTSSCRIGGATVDGDTAVTEAVMDLLGVDQRILSEYIFVPQRRMAGFVDETPGERNKTFGQLFDLAKAEAIYRLLDAAIKRVNPAPPSPELEPLRARVAAGQARLAELKKEVAAVVGTLKQLNPAAARALVERATRWASDQAVINTLTQQVEQLAAELEISQGELNATEAERVSLVEARAEAAMDIDDARASLAAWETVRLRNQRREVLAGNKVKLDAEPAAHPEPQPPDYEPGEEALNGKFIEMSHELRVRKDLLERFKDKPKICPTCGAETDAILAKAETYASELPALERLLASIQGIQKKFADYHKKHAAWQQWSQDYKKRLAALAEDWKIFAAGARDDPAADPDTCREVVEAGDVMERAIVEADARLVPLRQEVNRRAGRLDQDSLKLVKLQESRGEQPDPLAVVRAQRVLEEAIPLGQKLSRAEGERDAVGVGLGADEALLGRLEEAEQKAETDRLWAYHLGEVRKVMHHDKLPKVVAHNYLEILADDTNELLESFDSEFRVGLGEGLNFDASFLRGLYRGTVSPAQRLSEGQKVILALAFRVAVNSLFAGTAGLLCLDEPTESLDEGNLACLEVAIGRMRDLSESRGIQCLLVTHEPSFEALFDGVLRLTA
jgi:DNA repair exonuclease SbcCD ATPase subunit